MDKTEQSRRSRLFGLVQMLGQLQGKAKMLASMSRCSRSMIQV